jgi:D-tyrosyl-tRNA(Tyr) deacylase
MRAVVQRVRSAGVVITPDDAGGEPVARLIGSGFAVLLAIARNDAEAEAIRLVEKLVTLRVFPDELGRMNLDIRQAGGAFLVVSQFTLLANVKKGRRPSFERAADPETGQALYLHVVERLRMHGFSVETGEFGAHMLVALENDGPVTIILDTDDF